MLGGKYGAYHMELEEFLATGGKQEMKRFMKDLMRDDEVLWEDTVLVELKGGEGYEEVKRVLLWH